MIGRGAFVALALGLLAASACFAQSTPLAPPPVPAGNPLTIERIELGRALFWDEQLSGTGTVACGTCHRPGAGGSDPRNLVGVGTRNPGVDGVLGNDDDVQGSPGVPLHRRDGIYLPDAVFGFAAQVGGRRAPPAIGAAYSPTLFWDGRASGRFVDPDTGAVLLAEGGALENQALGPVANTSEMAHLGTSLRDVALRVGRARPLALADEVPAALADFVRDRDYPALFALAFGSPQVTPARMAFAIASYERTLAPTQTPLDRELAGTASLTALEHEGRRVFLLRGCAVCHAGPMLSDDAFHYIGVRPVGDDPGRFAVTGNELDRGAFRTPSLRNGELRAPYMHDGRFTTLEQVVAFYDRGGDFDAPNKDPLMVPLGLTAAERTALVAFMRRPLTDLRVAAELPPFDRPRLFSESDRAPHVEGVGRAGTGGRTPRLDSIEPPLLGNRDFSLFIVDGRPGALALVVADDADPRIGPPPRTARVAMVAITLDANGSGSARIVLPGRASDQGRVVHARAYVADSTAIGGMSVSPQLVFTLFGTGVRGNGEGDSLRWCRDSRPRESACPSPK